MNRTPSQAQARRPPADVRDARNRLLRRMSSEDRQRLSKHFEWQELLFKETVFEQDEPVDYVLFPESGVISLVVDIEGELPIETGTVGSEGCAGMSAILGAGAEANRGICQVAGTAFRLSARIIAAERQTSTAFFGLLLRYVHFMHTMAAQTAACNRLHHVDARMSRWLLMIHDRVERNDFPLTQEFLAQMLGVARPTVNIAGVTLQRAGLIRYSRGRMTILNRKGLESTACDCYERIQNGLEAAFRGTAKRRRTA